MDRRLPRIVVTGFGPFGRFLDNSSEQVARALPNHPTAGPYIAATGVLPVEFERSFETLAELLASVEHDAVVSFGLADDDALRLERVARNRNGASVADAAGVVLAGTIAPDAPNTIPSRLPLESIALRLASSGVAHRFSNDAGDYVCNNLFFRLLHEHRSDTTPCGLVHIPPLERWHATRLVDAAALIVVAVAEAITAAGEAASDADLLLQRRS